MAARGTRGTGPPAGRLGFRGHFATAGQHGRGGATGEGARNMIGTSVAWACAMERGAREGFQLGCFGGGQGWWI